MADRKTDTGTVVLGMQVEAEIAEIASEVIAGYTLTRRIGVGGFGEVWQAVGPGGLHKAVKILHGRYDGRQADVELRSLEKMKLVRHPFLLNIERIEVCDGRLIVVTELAEGSLEDRFNELRQEQARGIPREELLGYLRDGADALDFLYEQHGLQHLDVKPGNLLVQGNHVKLADFGLIKEVDRISESMVSGFTPLYAPPELFQGRPSRNSDQYSLAVVYQMMLTGEPPFSGRNAAQLVAQHLNSLPDLTPLAMADRPAVARALAKNPRARFDTCRQFVDGLLERRPRLVQATATPRSSVAVRPSAMPSSAASPDVREVSSAASTPLPPLRDVGSPGVLRPTLFLGVGGVGGKVLVQLRRRLQQEYGETATLPAFPFLYLDTDHASLQTVRFRADGPVLHDQELVEMRLRTALEYREHCREQLDWLSRRWLYNIPKSGLVEGIRPLGRLALVDHYSTVREHLRSVLEQGMTEKSLATTRQRTGLASAVVEPAVYLIASIGGGTGSGAVLDLAYLVQDVLVELGSRRHSVTGILLLPNTATYARQDVAAANAASCLRELQYCGTDGVGYPGDHACGLPANPAAPFDQVYLLRTPPTQGPTDAEEDPRHVAEYLYRQAATNEQSFFVTHRQLARESAAALGQAMQWGSFSLSTGCGPDEQALLHERDVIGVALVRRWLAEGGSQSRIGAATSAALEPWIHQLLHRLQLSADQLVPQVASIFAGEPAKLVERFARDLVAGCAGRAAGDNHSVEPLLRRCDRELTNPPAAAAPQHPARVLEALRRHLDKFASDASMVIQTESLALFDLPGGRLSIVSEALAGVAAQLDQVANHLAAVAAGIDRDIQSLSDAAATEWSAHPLPTDDAPPGQPEADSPWVSVCQKYAVLTLCAQLYRHVIGNLQRIREAINAAAAGRLAMLRRVLREQEMAMVSRLAAATATGAHVAPELVRPGQVEALARAVDERLHTDGESQLLTRLADENTAVSLWQTIRELIGDLLRAHAAQRDLDQWMCSAKRGDGGSAAALELRLTNAGGGHRVLAVVPESTSLAQLQQRLNDRFGNCVTMRANRSGDLFLCCEAIGLDWRLVIEQLANGNPEVLEAARRLHTRIDVNWGRAGS